MECRAVTNPTGIFDLLTTHFITGTKHVRLNRTRRTLWSREEAAVVCQLLFRLLEFAFSV
jgi:hypothetical protein